MFQARLIERKRAVVFRLVTSSVLSSASVIGRALVGRLLRMLQRLTRPSSRPRRWFGPPAPGDPVATTIRPAHRGPPPTHPRFAPASRSFLERLSPHSRPPVRSPPAGRRPCREAL